MANQYRSRLAGGVATGGDALPANVLSGKTFTNDNGQQTGTMVNNGAISQNLSAGQSYTIPEGYHDGNGVISDISASLLTTPRKYLTFAVSSAFTPNIGTYTSATEVTGNTGGGSVAIINVKGIAGNIAFSGDTAQGVRYIVFGVVGDVATTLHNGDVGNINFSDYDYLVVEVAHSGTSTLKFTITES